MVCQSISKVVGNSVDFILNSKDPRNSEMYITIGETIKTFLKLTRMDFHMNFFHSV